LSAWRGASCASVLLRLAKKSGEPVNMVVAERFGQDARGDQPVRQRVARAGGNLRAVGNHPPASVRRTREVGGVKMQKQMSPGTRMPWHGRRKSGWPNTSAGESQRERMSSCAP
jgi:hypothetical protein